MTTNLIRKAIRIFVPSDRSGDNYLQSRYRPLNHHKHTHTFLLIHPSWSSFSSKLILANMFCEYFSTPCTLAPGLNRDFTKLFLEIVPTISIRSPSSTECFLISLISWDCWWWWRWRSVDGDGGTFSFSYDPRSKIILNWNDISRNNRRSLLAPISSYHIIKTLQTICRKWRTIIIIIIIVIIIIIITTK